LLLLSAANEPKLKSEIRDLNEKLGKQEELIDEQSRKIEGLESEKSGLKAGEQGTLFYGKAKYGWPPCSFKFRRAFYSENVILLYYKTS